MNIEKKNIFHECKKDNAPCCYEGVLLCLSGDLPIIPNRCFTRPTSSHQRRTPPKSAQHEVGWYQPNEVGEWFYCFRGVQGMIFDHFCQFTEKILLSKICQKSQFCDKNAIFSARCGRKSLNFFLLKAPTHGPDKWYKWPKWVMYWKFFKIGTFLRPYLSDLGYIEVILFLHLNRWLLLLFSETFRYFGGKNWIFGKILVYKCVYCRWRQEDF